MGDSKKFLDIYKLDDIEGILLDFDGTLVPSEKVFLHAWQEIFENKYQCPFTEKEYIKYELERNTQLIDYLVENGRLDPNIEKSVFMQAVYNKYAIEYSNMLESTDCSPILEHIAKWVKTGIKLSIVSTSRREYIKKFFEKYEDYKNLFSCVLCREDVKELKPNPMIYLLAAEKMGLEYSKCLVIEDSPKGIEGAMAAHMPVIRVVENTFNIEENLIDFEIPVLTSIKNIIL